MNPIACRGSDHIDGGGSFWSAADCDGAGELQHDIFTKNVKAKKHL